MILVNSVIVVLGAKFGQGGEPSPSLLRRTISGCAYAEQFDGADLLFSGGQTHPSSTLSEADVMTRIALEKGISEHRIYKEDKSTNTLENIAFLAHLLKGKGWSDVYIVTDRPHLLRTRLVCRAVGIKAHFLPAHKSPRAGMKGLSAYLYEVVALLWYGIRILKGEHNKFKDGHDENHS